MTGLPPHCLASYTLVCSIFGASISKFNSPIYLSGVFQLNAACLRVSLPCLDLYASPILAILVTVVSPVSASFSAITVAVATWIATCVISVYTASNSAIPACILYISLPNWSSLNFCS